MTVTSDSTAARRRVGPTAPKALAAAHLELIARPAAVPSARRHARELVLEWERDDLAETAEHVVSELVTNAVQAASDLAPAAVWLSLAYAGDNVSVRVWDACGDMPVRQEAGTESEHGRGLMLVDVLSREWGVDRDRSGKTVWALL